jgi:hypothetical protein
MIVVADLSRVQGHPKPKPFLGTMPVIVRVQRLSQRPR